MRLQATCGRMRCPIRPAGAQTTTVRSVGVATAAGVFARARPGRVCVACRSCAWWVQREGSGVAAATPVGGGGRGAALGRLLDALPHRPRRLGCAAAAVGRSRSQPSLYHPFTHSLTRARAHIHASEDTSARMHKHARIHALTHTQGHAHTRKHTHALARNRLHAHARTHGDAASSDMRCANVRWECRQAQPQLPLPAADGAIRCVQRHAHVS
jgi:hypothetical protein